MKKVICSTIVTLLSCLFVLLFPKTVSALPQCYIDQLAQAEAEVQRTSNDLDNSFRVRDACKITLDQAIASGDPIAISKANDEYEHARALVYWYSDQQINAETFLQNVQKRNKTEEKKEKYDNYLISKGKYDIAASELASSQNIVNSLTSQIALVQSAIETYEVANDIANINALNVQLISLNAQLLQAQNDLRLKKATLELCLDDLEKYCTVIYSSDAGKVFVTYVDSPIWKSRDWNR